MEFPAAKTTPLHEAKPLNWGIAAPGEIAGMFTAAVNTYGTQNIAAVGSRSLERASAFAKEHSIDHVFGSYDALFASDAIEAVYISNHIDGHLDLANAALEAGKHVLVEKPLHYSPRKAEAIR